MLTLVCSNILVQMSVVLVLLGVWSGHSMMPWWLLLPGNVVVFQFGVYMVFCFTIPMATNRGMLYSLASTYTHLFYGFIYLFISAYITMQYNTMYLRMIRPTMFWK